MSANRCDVRANTRSEEAYEGKVMAALFPGLSSSALGAQRLLRVCGCKNLAGLPQNRLDFANLRPSL
jgi:hypothetical protein